MTCPRIQHLNNVPTLRGEKHDISLMSISIIKTVPITDLYDQYIYIDDVLF